MSLKGKAARAAGISPPLSGNVREETGDNTAWVRPAPTQGRGLLAGCWVTKAERQEPPGLAADRRFLPRDAVAPRSPQPALPPSVSKVRTEPGRQAAALALPAAPPRASIWRLRSGADARKETPAGGARHCGPAALGREAGEGPAERHVLLCKPVLDYTSKDTT